VLPRLVVTIILTSDLPAKLNANLMSGSEHINTKRFDARKVREYCNWLKEKMSVKMVRLTVEFNIVPWGPVAEPQSSTGSSNCNRKIAATNRLEVLTSKRGVLSGRRTRTRMNAESEK
jgi:hypothetical protein